MKTKAEICGREMEMNFFLAEVETKMERRSPAEQTRKRKFPFPTNIEFLFYGFFVWPI
jgi:hypothetical protein